MIGPESALIYTMVLVSAADSDMTDEELHAIGDIVKELPVFRDFDANRLPAVASACADLLAEEDGLERVLDGIVANLPDKLRETAYFVACDIAAADGLASQEELRLLEMLRDRLRLERLVAGAIERAIRAKSQRL